MCFTVISEENKTCQVGYSMYAHTIPFETTGNVTIPEEVNGYTVVSIMDNAFGRSNTNTFAFTSIVIPKSVTFIGTNVFGCCPLLSSITVNADNPVYDSRNNCNAIIETNSKTLISGCTSTVIPDEIETIGAYAFAGNNIDEITIPSRVSTIGEYAFRGCKNLESITIPCTVNSVGDYAFFGCTSLATFTIEGNTTFGSMPFSYSGKDASPITTLTINSQTIPDLFKYFSTLTTVNLGDDVKAIAERAFKDCTGLESINFSSGIETIADYAFQNCSSLRSISFPSSLTSIGYNSFDGCTSLESVTIEGANTTFDDTWGNPFGSFYSSNEKQCPIKTVTINCQTIPDIFRRCSTLTTVNFGNDVEEISEEAFAYCSALQKIVLGSGLESIGDYAFYDCRNLETIISNIEAPFSINTNCFSSIYNSATIYVPVGTKSTYQKTSAWMYFSNIIELPNFENGDYFTASSVEGVVMTFKVLDKDLFTCAVDCGNNISSIDTETTGAVTIPDKVFSVYSVIGIDDKAFRNCNGITSITIPYSVTSIGTSAFEGCSNLKSIYSLNEEPFRIDKSVFDVYETATLYVPYGKTSSYQATNGWSAFTNISEIGGNYELGEVFTKIVEGVEIKFRVTSTENFTCEVYGDATDWPAVPAVASNTKDVTIPSMVNGYLVTSIGSHAFEGCSLESITIPYGVTSIGYLAFSGCEMLESITIPNSVTSIGISPFNHCSKIKSIVIPNSVTSIGDDAFSSCTSLESITIGSGVSSIGNGIFEYCSRLNTITVDANNSVYDSRNNCNAIIETATNTLVIASNSTVIPNDIEVIGSFAFDYLDINTIDIPNSVTSIGDNAFLWCSNLESISIPSSVTSIGNSVFQNCISLSSIEVDVNNPVFDSRDNCNAIINKSTKTLIAACNTTTIPNSVQAIGSWAFAYLGIKTIDIPNSVTSIGDYAFYDCDLESISIPNSVTSIGDNAFRVCNMESISIPNSVTSIGSGAFWGCHYLENISTCTVEKVTAD